MISGVETRGLGGSMNPKLMGAPSPGPKNFMQEKNTILHVDSGRTMNED